MSYRLKQSVKSKRKMIKSSADAMYIIDIKRIEDIHKRRDELKRIIFEEELHLSVRRNQSIKDSEYESHILKFLDTNCRRILIYNELCRLKERKANHNINYFIRGFVDSYLPKAKQAWQQSLQWSKCYRETAMKELSMKYAIGKDVKVTEARDKLINALKTTEGLIPHMPKIINMIKYIDSRNYVVVEPQHSNLYYIFDLPDEIADKIREYS